MIACYVVTENPVPPAPEALLAAVVERAVWRAIQIVDEPGLLWNELFLQQPPFEARVSFTVGDALPADAITWMPWAGRELSQGEKACVGSPTATYRIEGPLLAGAVPLPGGEIKPHGPSSGGSSKTAASAEASTKDLPRRQAHFIAAVAAEIAIATSGVLVDVVSQRFRGPHAALVFTQASFDVREYVSVHAEGLVDSDLLHLHTHGLARFGRPDVEMGDVPRVALSFATHVLNEVAQHQALGNIVQNGESVVIDGDYHFAVSMTARSRDHVANEVVSLIDPPDAPQHDARAPRYSMSRFCEDVAEDLLAESKLDEALLWLTHGRELTPWRPELLRKRAAVLEHLGRADEAAEELRRAMDLET